MEVRRKFYIIDIFQVLKEKELSKVYSISEKTNLQKLRENKDILRQKKIKRMGCWKIYPLRLAKEHLLTKEMIKQQERKKKQQKEHKCGYIK